MESSVAVTYEIDDMLTAAEDLSQQIKSSLTLKANSIGILLAEGESEPDQLLPALKERLGIEIIGCTVTAQISSQGYHRLSNSLLVLSADDCRFSAQVSEELDENYAAQLTRAYEKARDRLNGEEVQAVFLFSIVSDYFTPDDTLAVISRLAGGKPVFGGNAADYYRIDDIRVFAEGQAFRHNAVLLLLSGNIKPAFIIRNIPRSSLGTSIVTKAHGGTVETIDNMTVYEYMQSHKLDVETDLSLFFAPLSVQYADQDDSDEPVCRPFYTMDRSTGFATSHGKIPQGATVSIRLIQTDDIKKATREAVNYIAGQIKNPPPGYKYSTVFIASCAIRHTVLGLENAFEGEFIKEMLPSITTAGFYAYGEYCPTSIKSGVAHNMAHNLSIALCLF
ncbi:MAG: FIST C-terminal domain-containing protein [Desulfarculales bacterium]|jgi:hypothetical protein|nr:FIST C-terminal domain-containing protein [Desulfarculales bacterium]